MLHGSERVVPLGASHTLPDPADPFLMAYVLLRTPPPQLFEQLDAPMTFHLASHSTAAVVVANRWYMYALFLQTEALVFDAMNARMTLRALRAKESSAPRFSNSERHFGM